MNNDTEANQSSMIEESWYIKLKLIAGTYLYQSYRGTGGKRGTTPVKAGLLAEKRHNLYVSGKYVQLFRLIQIEQEKINSKFNRRYNNRNGDLINIHDQNEARIIDNNMDSNEKKNNDNNINDNNNNSNSNFKRKRQDYNKLNFKSDNNAKKILTTCQI